MTLCEVRVPTYRRPRLLERALRSVVAQTHHDWRCIVLDDCPDASARAVVNAVGDARVSYLHNARSLGAIGNIDQAFRNRPMAGGACAIVLEDDNYLLPEHLAVQLETCRREAVAVTISAQLVEEIGEPGAPGSLSSDKRTLAWIYPEGRHACRSLLPAVLFSHAFSNGAVFWHIGWPSDFEIGDCTHRPGVQETLRLLKLKDDVYISHRATAVWRSNDPRDSYVSRSAPDDAASRLRARWQHLQERREISDYRAWYLDQHGIGGAIEFVRKLAPSRAPDIERALLLCGHYVALTDRSTLWRLTQIAKGHAFRAVVGSQIRMELLERGARSTQAAGA